MESAHTQNDSLTPSQRRAVAARGNVLVMAGAGTGKTHTLVQRCLDCLCNEGASLDEILVVTFTEAAATEMKQRLRRALEEKQQASPDGQHLAGQLALFDTAHIGTLHSFCLKLVREHFYELGLDPQMAVLDEGETRLLADETLDEELQDHYGGRDELAEPVQKLIQVYGGGRDEKIRQLVFRLHHYTQTRPDAEGWLARQIEKFNSPNPGQWHEWLLDGIRNWRNEWLPTLENLRAENVKAGECLEILKKLNGSARALAANMTAVDHQIKGGLPRTSANDEGVVGCARGGRAPQFTREQAVEVLEQIISADGNWPAKCKTALRKPLEKFFSDAEFLNSLAPIENGRDPLAEDWDWVRGPMSALLQLTQHFAARFAARKRDDGVLDFHDLEQFALKLLWDFDADKPTPVARHWREKIRFVFVDEYQDINAAQDKIIQAVGRDSSPSPRPSGERAGERGVELESKNLLTPPLSSVGGGEGEEQSLQESKPTGNRFLVGDVKQSIYRFRLADPKIFRDYAKTWRGGNGQVIPLAENFRSRESLLHFVNSVFELLMRNAIGGVDYDAGARLQFGAPEMRAALSTAKDASPRAELLLRFKTSRENNAEADDESGVDDLADLEETAKEARLLALRLKELKKSRHAVWDEEQKEFRAVEWHDMAVLLRAPSNKAEAYAKEFERAGVPLVVERGGFYDSAEILDLLSLLQLLDNPLQDVPAMAVLRSPFVGCSLDELAQIRVLASGRFWLALNQVQSPKSKVQSETRGKIGKFLNRFATWRQLARQASLSRCLEEVLAETHHADWLFSRPRGAQRRANVERFLDLAQKFDQFQRQGLFRFLKFVEAQREAEAEPEVAPVAGENAVRLMSIHQSKGLEFPVVAVANLAKPFNTQDLRDEIIFDEELGLCPYIKPPQTGRRYPSLPHWLAQSRQRREQWGEELRLLYVAMTRARDTLILTGTITEKKWGTLWTEPGAITTQAVITAKSYADWLGLWFAHNQVQSPSAFAKLRRDEKSKVQSATEGELPHLRWRIADDAELRNDLICRSRGDEHVVSYKNPIELDDATKQRLRDMLTWEYGFGAATKRKAKQPVTALSRTATDELDEESAPIFVERKFSRLPQRSARGKISAAATGTAHHKFLQYFSFESAASLASLAAEAKRLEQGKVLSADERAALNLENVAAFWNSAPGQKIRRQPPEFVKRELSLTVKFSIAELDDILGEISGANLENEFVVVQGRVDLAVLSPKEIWLVDFKTDNMNEDDFSKKEQDYKKQLKLYAQALEKIYSRPVTNCWLHFLSARKTVSVEI
jgi:ATP-dependent helicase/nuclease subunit A